MKVKASSGGILEKHNGEKDYQAQHYDKTDNHHHKLSIHPRCLPPLVRENEKRTTPLVDDRRAQ
jgi:hypothetical protein